MLRSLLLFLIVILFSMQVRSQPYVDPIQVRYMHAFKNSKYENTPFSHLWVGSDLPLKLKENTYLILSPYYEQWDLNQQDKSNDYPVVQSLCLPIGIIMPIENSKWSLNCLPIVRWNGEKLFAENTFQYGTVTFATFSKTPKKKLRFGVYANKEFFGWFVIPLIGADWKINDNNYLFGLLPGRLTYEHKWNAKLYGGATLRFPMNSYRLTNQQYVRLDDNQVSVYMDYYIAKHFCLTLEPGVGILRKIRTGTDFNEDYNSVIDWGSGPFIKLSAAYRIRL